MVTHPTKQLETLREKIESGERGGSEEDQEALLEFINRLRLLGSQYSDQRREKLLRYCTIIAEELGGLADALENWEAAEDIVLWINLEYDNGKPDKTTEAPSGHSGLIWPKTGRCPTVWCGFRRPPAETTSRNPNDFHACASIRPMNI
jgi:hypothetical protein